ncbi:hypothetical protein [Polaromonas sp.]|jgi:hypothetical protein|uniref:hypothetical protein n=1 Tax=Polaromonas sp. TaxID=1869339 RepID=UPI0017ACEFFA|nr:hypothetical protein [Polaromonas sp.]NMM06951.1 hypothetical protein [Polaromonas sp.]
MRHLMLRARMGTVPPQSWRWALTDAAGESRWQLLTEDGADTGLRTANSDLSRWAKWVEAVSPLEIADQLRQDDWSDEAANRLRQAGAVLERLQGRAYGHRERHHYNDLAWLRQLLQQAQYCLSAPDIEGMEALERVGSPGKVEQGPPP